MHRPTLRITLACTCAALLAACGGERGGGARAEDGEVADSLKFGGTATVGGYADLQSMNALTSSDNNSG